MARTGMTAPLRILMLIPEFGFGGAEGAFLRLARYLATRVEVTIGVIDRPYSESPASAAGGWIDLPVFRLDDGLGPRGGLIGKARRWWKMLRRLRLLKRRHDVTISFLSGVNLLNALSGPRGQTIVSERGSKRHNIGMTTRQRLLWTQFLDPLTYWRAGHVVAASEGLAYEIVAANPWASPRVSAIEGTVEAAKLVDAADLPIEPELQPLAECETVVAFGRLDVAKGFDFLLTAFANVRTERPAARLLLIGSGPEETRLRARAAELGLVVADQGAAADVILPGMRRDPVRYLRLARVFVLPSRSEGLPNALIEALAAGLPVLAADCPWGPRSILAAGRLAEGEAASLPLPLSLAHGLLMPPPDVPGATEVWAREMVQVLAAPPLPRPERADRLASIARYDIAQTGPRWLQLIRQMAHEGGPL